MDLALAVLYPPSLGSRATPRAHEDQDQVGETIVTREQAVLELERVLVGLGDLDRLEFWLCTFMTDCVPPEPEPLSKPAIHAEAEAEAAAKPSSSDI